MAVTALSIEANEQERTDTQKTHQVNFNENRMKLLELSHKQAKQK